MAFLLQNLTEYLGGGREINCLIFNVKRPSQTAQFISTPDPTPHPQINSYMRLRMKTTINRGWGVNV